MSMIYYPHPTPYTTRFWAGRVSRAVSLWSRYVNKGIGGGVDLRVSQNKTKNKKQKKTKMKQKSMEIRILSENIDCFTFKSQITGLIVSFALGIRVHS